MVAIALAVYGGVDRADEIRLKSGTFGADAIGGGGLAVSSLSLNSNGDAVHSGIGFLTNSLQADEWHRDNPLAGLGDDWEVRATLTAGSALDSGTLGSFEALSTNRTWAMSHNAAPAKTSTLSFEFRLIAAPATTITVSNVVLSAIWTPL